MKNMSCVIHRRTQQRTTTVFYQLFILSPHDPCYNYASTVQPSLKSICLPHVYLMSYYSSTIHLPQG